MIAIRANIVSISVWECLLASLRSRVRPSKRVISQTYALIRRNVFEQMLEVMLTL